MAGPTDLWLSSLSLARRLHHPRSMRSPRRGNCGACSAQPHFASQHTLGDLHLRRSLQAIPPRRHSRACDLSTALAVRLRPLPVARCPLPARVFARKMRLPRGSIVGLADAAPLSANPLIGRGIAPACARAARRAAIEAADAPEIRAPPRCRVGLGGSGAAGRTAAIATAALGIPVGARLALRAGVTGAGLAFGVVHALVRWCAFKADAPVSLCRHPFPGRLARNVRTIGRSVAFRTGVFPANSAEFTFFGAGASDCRADEHVTSVADRDLLFGSRRARRDGPRAGRAGAAAERAARAIRVQFAGLARGNRVGRIAAGLLIHADLGFGRRVGEAWWACRAAARPLRRHTVISRRGAR